MFTFPSSGAGVKCELIPQRSEILHTSIFLNFFIYEKKKIYKKSNMSNATIKVSFSPHYIITPSISVRLSLGLSQRFVTIVLTAFSVLYNQSGV